ncbi:hypothetical protein BAE44_0022560 [Dichanthelium oligosanthes]|uniref:4Fe-4S ferredoxin-type domain-containing protein n=1 Tax=Dichanthelium oligosanthes TaxID=888268 RepID=A0A1E5UU94_9POAL|nr:hypothetical protein BAE44_0022560 [Dichanthelium oligosanthes]
MVGGRGTMLWLALLVSARIVSVSSDGEAVNGQPLATPGPDTNVLCVSKCGTCPTVCSSPPPPSPSDAGDSTTPPTPKSGGGGYSSPPSPKSYSPSPPGQGKGDRPSSYYYLFTAAGSRTSCAGASIYALVFLVLVSVVANLL